MIDIHTHLLPNIDDGSQSIEESVFMSKEEVKNLVTDAICTPHMRLNVFTPKKEEVINSYNKLKEALTKQNIPLNLHLGWELHHSDDVIKQNEVDSYVYNGKNVVLLEFKNDEEDGVEICYKYIKKGYKVILAHVERYDYIIDDYDELKNLGVMFQVNAESVVGKSIFKCVKRVKKLLKLGYVDFVASDIHYTRTNQMLKAKIKIEKKYGTEVANKLFIENAKKVLL